MLLIFRIGQISDSKEQVRTAASLFLSSSLVNYVAIKIININNQVIIYIIKISNNTRFQN